MIQSIRALQESLRNLDKAFKNFFEKKQDIPNFTVNIITINPTVREIKTTAFVSLGNTLCSRNWEKLNFASFVRWREEL